VEKCLLPRQAAALGHLARRDGSVSETNTGLCQMSAEIVTVTIDDRSVQVPKGLGLIEAGLVAGIEVPVFCYEPRLGAPLGACRMCLVEVEGMPKLQAGCTLTAQDGMVVRTATTSEKAAEGQEATLEFILVNHPLDCPVCDKGGECPLQDLTFRYGPGNTRMTFLKRTFDKPIPISPLIALDRERCILCYRCTRFSESVSEDGQLVAVNRGAQTMIATFEDEPYRAPFSGNVIELCPVGALTSTTYRFEARPWEIQNVPTVCGLCPVGCNVTATTREGKVKRILARNHPEVDEGWLCDKGRFGYPSLRADDRVTAPLRLTGPRRYAELSPTEAVDEAERLLRGAQARVVTVLSGSETVELTYALAKLLRRGIGAHSAVLSEETTDALDAYRLSLSAIAGAELIVVLGDDPVAERAPIVELWLRSAERNGAEIVTIGAAADACRELAQEASELGRRLRQSDRAVVIWSGPGGGGGVELARLAERLGFADKEGCGAFYLPATPNARGVADAWSAAADEEATSPEPIGLLLLVGDEAVANPDVRALAAQADKVIAFTSFRRPAAGWADLILPGTSYLERDGTMVNLEGRLQRLRRAVVAPSLDELTIIAALGPRFGVDVPDTVPELFAELSARVYDGLAFALVEDRAPLPPRPAARPVPEAEPSEVPPAKDERGLELLRYRPLFSGPAVERVPELQFQRPGAEVELTPADASNKGIAPGDLVTLRSGRASAQLTARINRQLREGVARVAEEHARELGARVEISRARRKAVA
jgi:NADH-quinone oxidoreductase subunit G